VQSTDGGTKKMAKTKNGLNNKEMQEAAGLILALKPFLEQANIEQTKKLWQLWEVRQ
jgi:hypothetical protein